MSLCVAEAPHLCTSALRLMGKQTGWTVLKAVKTPHDFMVNLADLFPFLVQGKTLSYCLFLMEVINIFPSNKKEFKLEKIHRKFLVYFSED